MTAQPSLWRRPLPHRWWLGPLGAALGILAAALAGRYGLAAMPWLLAPLGASAVLVFAVPASPLAQPWPVIGGNGLSLLIGLAVGHGVPVPVVAAALAVGLAIAVMIALGCLHPPGGACALVGVLAAASPGGGWSLVPTLAANVAGLCAAGWLYHRWSGHAWPHRAPAAPAPLRGYERAHLDAVLAEWDETLDVDPDDLDALIRAVEARSLQR